MWHFSTKFSLSLCSSNRSATSMFSTLQRQDALSWISTPFALSYIAVYILHHCECSGAPSAVSPSCTARSWHVLRVWGEVLHRTLCLYNESEMQTGEIFLQGTSVVLSRYITYLHMPQKMWNEKAQILTSKQLWRWCGDYEILLVAPGCIMRLWIMSWYTLGFLCPKFNHKPPNKFHRKSSANVFQRAFQAQSRKVNSHLSVVHSTSEAVRPSVVPWINLSWA
jgi:hypothetical protein